MLKKLLAAAVVAAEVSHAPTDLEKKKKNNMPQY